MCLQTGLSAQAERQCIRGVLPESGHSLEYNGPFQMREHSLLEIRRWGLWADSAVDRDFTPLCYTITCMHLRCAEKAYSCSLEFCLGGFYNKRQLVFCPVLFLRPECVCRLSLVCLVLCHFTHNLQQSFSLALSPIFRKPPLHPSHPGTDQNRCGSSQSHSVDWHFFWWLVFDEDSSLKAYHEKW